jgi:DNA-binding transcriptional LysR family regulator
VDRLETMRVYVAVAEARGFAAAARRLAMSPPAVTRAVAAVEKRIGAQLLRRSTRVVKLTEAGERFLVDCKRILAAIDDAEEAAAGSQGALRGLLSITASVMFGKLFVAPLLLEFLAQHREVTGRALLLDRVVDLLEEGIDVAVRIAPLEADSLAVATRVGAVGRVACASPAYLAAHGVPKTPRDLSRHRAVVFAHGAAPADWQFHVDGAIQLVRPKAELIVNSTEVTLEAAVAGRGITMALSYQVMRELAEGRLVRVLEEFEPPAVPVHVIYTGGIRAPARARAFARFAVERLRAEPALRIEGFSAKRKRTALAMR